MQKINNKLILIKIVDRKLNFKKNFKIINIIIEKI